MLSFNQYKKKIKKIVIIKPFVTCDSPGKDQCCRKAEKISVAGMFYFSYFGDENVSLVEIYSIDKTTTCREFYLTGGPLRQKLFLLKYKHLYLIQVP